MADGGALSIPDDELSETPESLRRKDDLLLTALLSGANNRQAANESGYSERTVSRRVRDPGFRRRLIAGRAQLQDRTLNALLAAGTAGVQVLLEAAMGAPPQVEQRFDAETGEMVRVITLGVPWAQRVSAGRALVELGVGALVRTLTPEDTAGDPQDADDSLTAKLEAYEARIPGGLRLIEGTATDGPPTTVGKKSRPRAKKRA